jgi:hypothetical protein
VEEPPTRAAPCCFAMWVHVFAIIYSSAEVVGVEGAYVSWDPVDIGESEAGVEGGGMAAAGPGADGAACAAPNVVVKGL